MKNPRTTPWLRLLLKVISFAKPFRKPLSLVFLCVLGATIVSAMTNYFTSKIFDLVQTQGINDKVYAQAIKFLLISVLFEGLRIIFVGLRSLIDVKKLDLVMPNYLTHKSIAKFLSFSNGQHVNEHSGVRQSIVNNGTSSIQSQINLLTVQFFPVITSLFVAMFILFYAHWSVGSVFLLCGLIFCLMMYKHNKKLLPGIRKTIEQRQQNSRFVSELYRYVTLVKNESQENKALEEVALAQQQHQDLYTKTWIPGLHRIQWTRSTSNFISYAARFLVVYLLFHGMMTIGTIYLVFSYGGVFINALWDLTGMHKQFLTDRVNIEKYLELMEIKPDIIMLENPLRPDNFYGNIEFKNVTFKYPERVRTYKNRDQAEEKEAQESEPVLRNVSFTIKKGEKIGIVGSSGSGKSTLVNLIMRSSDPQDGQVLIDGNDLRLLDIEWFRKHVGLVGQEVELFDQSLERNILFGLGEEAKDFPKEKLMQVIEMVKLTELVENSEYGLETMVGEKGLKLSGGERQRLGIARAIIKNPDIMMFDEATSSLDYLSEKKVQESIYKASEGKTAIIIAHRLPTVRNCDRIYVFRNGKIISEGTHQELLEKCEYYNELVAHQAA